MGRKSFKEELGLKQRYADLTGPAFKFLRECLEGSSRLDKKWAVEQLSKGFVKMLPTEVSGVDGAPIPILIHMNVPIDTGDPKDSQAQETDSGSTGRNVGE